VLAALSDGILTMNSPNRQLSPLRELRPLLGRRCFQGLYIEINAFNLGLCQTNPDEVRSFVWKVGYAPATHLPESQHTDFAFSRNEFFLTA
jgi:hypothetical protein